MPMDAEQMLALIDERLQRIETAVRELVAARGELARTLSAMLHSQAIYLGDHRALTFLQNGQKLFVDTRSIDVGTHLLLDGWWEANYMAAFGRLLRPGQTVLDVGANHGIYALVAAKRVGPQGRVFAFEPNPGVCELLRASVSVNGLGDIVQVVQAAVADAEGDAELQFDEHWAAAGHLRPENQEKRAAREHGVARSERVRLVSVDGFFRAKPFAVDVVKIDAEGSEGLVLEGMKQVIERSPRLRIMLEFCPSMLARYSRDANFVVRFLDERRFMAWSIADDGAVMPVSWRSLLDEPDRVRNVIASREAIG
jgi:FkbM family methyltransferase